MVRGKLEHGFDHGKSVESLRLKIGFTSPRFKAGCVLMAVCTGQPCKMYEGQDQPSPLFAFLLIFGRLQNIKSFTVPRVGKQPSLSGSPNFYDGFSLGAPSWTLGGLADVNFHLQDVRCLLFCAVNCRPNDGKIARVFSQPPPKKTGGFRAALSVLSVLSPAEELFRGQAKRAARPWARSSWASSPGWLGSDPIIFRSPAKGPKGFLGRGG